MNYGPEPIALTDVIVAESSNALEGFIRQVADAAMEERGAWQTQRVQAIYDALLESRQEMSAGNHSHHLAIMLAIITSLYSISIMNAFLLMVALLFMWNSDYDKKWWSYFNGIAIALLFIKQIGNNALNLQEYNIEYLALAGFVSIEEQTVNLSTDRGLMIFNFILVFFTSGWYKRLNTPKTAPSKKESQKDELQRQIDLFEELEFDGVVQEALPNAMFNVKCDNGLSVLATISGRMRQFYIRILPGLKTTIRYGAVSKNSLCQSVPNCASACNHSLGKRP